MMYAEKKPQKHMSWTDGSLCFPRRSGSPIDSKPGKSQACLGCLYLQVEVLTLRATLELEMLLPRKVNNICLVYEEGKTLGEVT